MSRICGICERVEIHDENVVNRKDLSRVCFTRGGMVKYSSRLSWSRTPFDEELGFLSPLR